MRGCYNDQKWTGEVRGVTDRATDPKRSRGPGWRGILSAFLLIAGGLLLLRGLPASDLPGSPLPPDSTIALASSVAPLPAPAATAPADKSRFVTADIEDIKRFEWVIGENPEGAIEGEDADAIDWRDWRFVDTLFTKPDGTVSEVNLARPVAWVDDQQATVGSQVYLDLPELGIDGLADVVRIGPAIDPGTRPSPRHSLVTATFKHTAPDTIDLYIEDTEPIGCTSNHPFWSVDREEFVEAGHLNPDEQVLLATGDTRRVIQTDPRPGPATVYNLEVHGQHVYHVASTGVLVHNSCIPKLRQAYESEVRALAKQVPYMRAKGFSSEQIARQLSSQRRKIGIKFKNRTPSELLDKIYEGNVKRYGDRLGPKVEDLFKKKGSWESVIESASKPGKWPPSWLKP